MSGHFDIFFSESPCDELDEFSCKNGNCVSINVTCDANNDCGDFSDEFECESQGAPEYEVTYDYDSGEYDPLTNEVVPEESPDYYKEEEDWFN